MNKIKILRFEGEEEIFGKFENFPEILFPNFWLKNFFLFSNSVKIPKREYFKI